MRLQGASRKTKTMVFVALFLISCSMVFLQLGFSNLDGRAEGEHYVFALVPVVVTAFLLGAPWGLLQGALTGVALSVHAILQPIDWMERAFTNPIRAIVPLALLGFGLGLAFSRLIGPQHTRRHNVLLTALLCAVVPVLYDLAFTCVLLLYMLGFSKRGLVLFAEAPILAAPSTLLCESIVLFASLMLADGLLRHVMMPGTGVQLHVVFGSRLFGLLLVVFVVIIAAGYTLITHLDVVEASKEMASQLEAISDCLKEYRGRQELDDTMSAIFKTIVSEKDGSVVLLDNTGKVVASNDEAYAKGSYLTNEDGLPLLSRVKALALGATMDLMHDWDVGEGSAKDIVELAFQKLAGNLNYVRAKRVDDYYLLQMRTHETVFRDRIVAMHALVLTAGIALVLAFVFASNLLHAMVEQPINSANKTLAKITDGDLSQRVQLRSSKELASLADYINAAVAALKEYATESERRIERDLSMARDIQESALPRTFPPFPEVDAFDVYASMQAAKYVGGDFYDFFLVGDHKLGFLIADVSGKGIPAALFMMRAKTRIATAMRSGIGLVQAVTKTNDYLCEGNDTFMFVTMWAAILDWDTGELTYVNAGHDIPLLRHNDQWQWFEDVGGALLGAMDSETYECATVTLSQGDAVFLYTDGVTEAMNHEDQLYGKDRMLEFLQQHADLHPRELDDATRAEVAAWADGAEQSDDITMLTLEYRGA